MTTMQQLVTKASMIAMLADEQKRQHVIGRALVAIFKCQTEAEKASNTTRDHNEIGFAGPDARQGTLSAKYYLKHKCLLPWQVDLWIKDFRGSPRITKYWQQLNVAANRKRALEQVGS